MPDTCSSIEKEAAASKALGVQNQLLFQGVFFAIFWLDTSGARTLSTQVTLRTLTSVGAAGVVPLVVDAVGSLRDQPLCLCAGSLGPSIALLRCIVPAHGESLSTMTNNDVLNTSERACYLLAADLIAVHLPI